MKKQVHVVPHFHWDREWYFTAEESNYLLLNDMEEVLDILEKDNDYPCFVMDGQTSIVEDYLRYCPENRDRFEKLVRDGKLRIGPWYTQTDEMVVGGESIVRNLLYGHRDAAKIGPCMEIGYLPDSFGQSGQMPMILNGFGITRSIFWRGASERKGTDKNDFCHESEDGSRVLVHMMPLGYAIGKYLPEDRAQLKKRMDKYLPVLDHGATGADELLPNGHDQMPVQKNIHTIVKELNELYPDHEFFLGDYEGVFESLEKKDSYDVLKGELLDGKYMRVHRSIYSSRADLKAYNAHLESRMTNVLEPLASLAHSLGFPYFSHVIEEIWKELLKNQAHDSMGCCCSDKVHSEIMARFAHAEESMERMIDFYKRRITDAMNTETIDRLTAYNLTAQPRAGVIHASLITRMKGFTLRKENGEKVPYSLLHTEIVDAGLIDRQIVHYGCYDPFVKYEIEFEDTLPAMGYRSYRIAEAAPCRIASEQADTLENEYYSIRAEADGTLTITDRKDQTVFRKVLMLEECSDDGDGYDWSPMKDDRVYRSTDDVSAEVSITKHPLSSHAEIRYTWNLPKDLEERRAGKRSGRIDAVLTVDLKKGSRIIDCDARIVNSSCDHRVRAILPCENESCFTVADTQFGSITRAVRDDAMEYWEKENWKERPDAIYPMLSYVHLQSSRLCFLTDSVREFEAIDEKTLAVTLFRSTGFLGKEDLLRRPGRPSGIRMETPDQQMLREMHFRFAIAFADGKDAPVLAKDYLTPVETYNRMPYNAMKMNVPEFETPCETGLLEVKDPHFILSALKLAEDGNGYILRGFNASDEPVSIEVNSSLKPVSHVRLDETDCPAAEAVKNRAIGIRLKQE